MGRVIDRGKKRRAAQRKKERAKPQHYGGSEQRAKDIAGFYDAEIDRGQDRIDEGLDTLAGERGLSLSRNRDLRVDAAGQRGQYAELTEQLGNEAADRGRKYEGREDAYGESADRSLGDYRGGRGAILGGADRLENNDWMNDFKAGRGDILGGATRLEGAGNRSADMLEGYAQGAAGEYQSAADAAFQAAQNRNQKNALALAAGRGAGSIRTALATANSGNQQAALDQQVVKAQEMNALNAMRNQAVADAAGIRMGGIEGATGIRSGLSAQDLAAAEQRANNAQAAAAIRSGVAGMDQQAASLEAARQEAARQAVGQTAAFRAGVGESNAGFQRDMLGLVQNSNQADTAAGFNLGGAVTGAGESQRGSGLNAQQTQYGQQLSADTGVAMQQAEAWKGNNALAKTKDWTGALTLGILG